MYTACLTATSKLINNCYKIQKFSLTKKTLSQPNKSTSSYVLYAEVLYQINVQLMFAMCDNHWHVLSYRKNSDAINTTANQAKPNSILKYNTNRKSRKLNGNYKIQMKIIQRTHIHFKNISFFFLFYSLSLKIFRNIR